MPGLSIEDGFTRHPFDEAHGVRTSGLIAGRHLRSGQKDDRHITAYFGVAPSVFRAIVRRWQKSKPVAPLEDFTFIDIGAGMGRAVLLASEMPFREVIGIELNPLLARIARKNLTRWRAAGYARTRMHITCTNAVEFRFPARPCLIYLFNPFGATVMRRLLSRLAASFAGKPGFADVLYVNNEQEAEFERRHGFQRLFAGKIARSRSDAIADYKIMAAQPDGEYAASNDEDCSIWRWKG